MTPTVRKIIAGVILASCCWIVGGVLAAPASITHTIPQIQGAQASSPYAGTRQTTQGVVTLVLANGFFMQDPLGDGNAATSDGIWVYTNTAPLVSAGDRVRVTAIVSEYNPGTGAASMTELGHVSRVKLIDRGNQVAPTSIGLPMASASVMRRYQGMLVHFSSTLTVTQNYFLGRYGQLGLSSGRLEKPTNRHAAGSPQAVAAAAANAANRIVLDDDASMQNPYPIPYLGFDNTVRAGDTVSDLTGVIDFGLTGSNYPGPAGYKLQPTQAPVFVRANPRNPAPISVPISEHTPAPGTGMDNLTVASFNVMNFFTTFTDGHTASGESNQGCVLGASIAAANCRGARNAGEFFRQRSKIVAAMQALDADLFGLMEMQNLGDSAVSNLVDALNAAMGKNTYALVALPPLAGSTGFDAIRVAMIYKPGSLTLLGAALSDPNPVNNRPPMAQTFQTRSGKKFSLIVNHMKSKSRCPEEAGLDSDRGDGQGCWNARRLSQAQRLANVFIPAVQAAASASDVLVIGDLNAYGAEDPVNFLTGSGLVNQIERFIRPATLPYSYVFNGEAGYIDHVLASASMNAKVVGVAEWHINADEPSVLDYSLENKAQDLYAPTPFRSSDHDPVVIRLKF